MGWLLIFLGFMLMFIAVIWAVLKAVSSAGLTKRLQSFDMEPYKEPMPKTDALTRNIQDLTLDIGNYDVDPKIESNIQVLLDYYNPQRGVFTSWWQRRKGTSRAELQRVLNEEQMLVIESASKLETAVREGKRTQVEFKMFVAQNAFMLLELKTKARLIEDAFGKGMTVEDYSDVSAYKEKKEVDKDYEAWQIEQKLTAVHRYQMSEDELLNRLRAELEQAIIKQEEIENGTYTQAMKHNLRTIQDQKIDNLKFRITSREKRLIEDESA